MRCLLIVTCCLCCAVSIVVKADEAVVLKAGAATSNITPALGGEIVGGFQPIPATHIHDELHARCLVLESGQTRLAMVVCDLLGFHRCVSDLARQFIQDETGIPKEHVLISATHTHSATTALGRTRYQSQQEPDLLLAKADRPIARPHTALRQPIPQPARRHAEHFDVIRLQSGFFLQLTKHRFLRCLVSIHPALWKLPAVAMYPTRPKNATFRMHQDDADIRAITVRINHGTDSKVLMAWTVPQQGHRAKRQHARDHH